MLRRFNHFQNFSFQNVYNCRRDKICKDNISCKEKSSFYFSEENNIESREIIIIFIINNIYILYI